MRKRPTPNFLPAVQRLEEKLVLSAGGAASARPHVGQAAEVSIRGTRPQTGFLVYRVTNPTIRDVGLEPPFGHVLVQAREPVLGGTYNILQVAVKKRDQADVLREDDLRVRLSGQTNYTQILAATRRGSRARITSSTW